MASSIGCGRKRSPERSSATNRLHLPDASFLLRLLFLSLFLSFFFYHHFFFGEGKEEGKKEGKKEEEEEESSKEMPVAYNQLQSELALIQLHWGSKEEEEKEAGRGREGGKRGGEWNDHNAIYVCFTHTHKDINNISPKLFQTRSN